MTTEEDDSYEALTVDALRERGPIKWNYFDPDVLPLWVAEMDFRTAPVVRAAIQAAVDREEFGYPRMEKLTGLPQAIAEWSRSRYGWSVDPSHVHLLPDVLKGVELAIENFSPSGSAVVLPTPAYMPFFEVPKIVGRRIIEVPMAVDAGRYTLDLAGIDDALAEGAGTLILCQPYNPLGREFTREEMLAVSAVVERHGARVAADEIHAPLVYGRAHVPYASVGEQAAAHTVTLVSASKAWNLPGLKCAAAITNSDRDEERWQQISMMKTHGASTIGIAANLAAFSAGASWLDGLLDRLDANRTLLGELLAEHLPQVGYNPPEATYMTFWTSGNWISARSRRTSSCPTRRWP